MIAPRRAIAIRALGFTLMIGLCGCVNSAMLPLGGQQSEYEKKVIKEIEKAAFSISGGDIFVRSNDANPWQDVHITLDTDDGYFRQAAGDMEPGQVRELTLKSFVDDSGNAFGPNNRLKDVWVQARYPSGDPVTEMAYPGQTFGYQSAVPPGG
jgi:hypothetical protein